VGHLEISPVDSSHGARLGLLVERIGEPLNYPPDGILSQESIRACHSCRIVDMATDLVVHSPLESTPIKDGFANSSDSQVLRAPEAEVNGEFQSRAERYARHSNADRSE
jgi:hypothetical protein